MTISSRLNFGRPAPPGRGSAAGRIFLAPTYYSQRAVFASLRALFSLIINQPDSVSLLGRNAGSVIACDHSGLLVHYIQFIVENVGSLEMDNKRVNMLNNNSAGRNRHTRLPPQLGPRQ